LGTLRGGICRCMPEEPPLPRRLASTLTGEKPAADTATDKAMIQVFMKISLCYARRGLAG
jgi:hypothetical protein